METHNWYVKERNIRVIAYNGNSDNILILFHLKVVIFTLL